MVTATPIFPQAIVNSVAQINNAAAQTLQTLVAGGTNGTKIESITATSTDTAAHDVQLWLTISSVNYLLGTISVPAGAGNSSGVPSVDFLKNAQITSFAYDANGNKYIYVANGATLSISSVVTVTSGKLIQAYASGGSF